MTRIALIGAALTAALSTAGCLDTMAVLRGDRVVETAEEVRQHPDKETVLAGLGAPLQADQGQSGEDASEATDTKLSRQVLRRKRQDARPPALSRSSIAAKAITHRPDVKRAAGPVPRPVTLSKNVAQLASPSHQSAAILRGSPLPQRPGSGSPAVTREQPPALPTVKGATPVTSQTNPVQTFSSPRPQPQLPASSEPPRHWSDPSSPEPSVIGSNPASARVGPTAARPEAEVGAFERDDRQTASLLPPPRVTSTEAQLTSPQPNLPQRERESLVLYLAVRDDIRSLADLNGKTIALSKEVLSAETAIKQAFAAARVTPNFVGDVGTDTLADALGRLMRREVAATPFGVFPPQVKEPSGFTETLSQSGLRLLEVPLDPQAVLSH
jgi:hypothetical protein